MKRKALVYAAILLLCVQALAGCGKTTVTQTEVRTVTGPAITQTVNVTGPVTTNTQTITQTTTQTATTTLMATVTGPTTTLTTTQTGIVTQGVTYVSSITPASPATLHNTDWVQVAVDYVVTDAGGAHLWAIPMTSGQNTPNSGYSAPTLSAGKGTIILSFNVASGSVKVDQIHLLMRSLSNNAILFEAFLPVSFTYGP